MGTITEDYVSFETAKLLKDKGFNVEGSRFYMPNGHGMWKYGYYHDFDISERIECPTHQMAMKWLREAHKIYIDISPTYSEAEKTIHFIWQIFDSNYDFAGDCEIFYDKYEQACEAAIKYCLENLIFCNT